MKRTLLLSVVLCLSLVLTGCGAGSANTASVAVGVEAGQGAVRTANDGQISLALQLALGTLQLDETQYPVNAEQAVSLLPLWKAARSLGKNDTAATQEVNALVKQIQSTMTSEQLQAISSMELTTQDFPALAQELGLEIGSVEQPASSGSTAQTAGQSGQAPPGGDLPVDGGGPPDGSMPVDGGGPSGAGSQTSQTGQVLSSGSGAFLGVSQTLLDTVIEFLEAKV